MKISKKSFSSFLGLAIIGIFMGSFLFISQQNDNLVYSGSSTDPSVIPIPEFDFDDPAKSMVVSVLFNDMTDVTFESSHVSFERAHTHIGDPPLILAQTFDLNGILIGQFNSWHPLWTEVQNPDGSFSMIVLESGQGVFIFPFNSHVTTMKITDIPMNQELISVDLTSTIVSFCLANPQEADCIIPLPTDIKPGSFPNSINSKSKGVVAVAILGTDAFDVTEVDVTTLKFGPSDATPYHDLSDPEVYAEHLEDVNLDGFTDLISHYVQKQTGLTKGDTEACFSGKTLGGTSIEGCDSVRVKK